MALVSALAWSTQSMAAPLDFNRDVQPILSEKCYFCHGPDAKHREADLRLDQKEGANAAIVSGEFLARIETDDPDLRMPKPASKLFLSETEKQVLRQWIEAGAKYESHWAFRPLPKRVPIPKIEVKEWLKQPFEAFVAEEHAKHGLQPAEEADPLRWFRRVSIDLTGLPPSSDQVAIFQSKLNSNRESLYAATVDELLASTAFGEHLAATWLDASRYADSYGYQSDKLNNQWPYRDWVVRAFNRNQPYDEFLVWQLAGDLLDNPTREQRLATAFNRIHRLNNEGGAVFEEWRQENVADRVHTFGTAVLGLTLECCRCHDHKYDPISTRDYYALSAFFNSIDENGLYDRTEKIPSPSMLLPTAEQSAELAKRRIALAQAEASLSTIRQHAEERWKLWTATGTQDSLPSTLPDLEIEFDFDEQWHEGLAKQYLTVTNDKTKAEPLPVVTVGDSKITRLKTSTEPRRAYQFDGERGIKLEGAPELDRWIPFSLTLTFREAQRNENAVVLAQQTRGTDAGYNGWDLMLDRGYLESRMYRVWPGNAIGVRTMEPIAVDQWHQVTATYNGSSRAEGLKLYLDGVPLKTTVLRDKVIKRANVQVDHGGNLVLGQRFRGRGFAHGLIDDVRIFSRELSLPEIKNLALGRRIEPTLDYYLSAIDEDYRQATHELKLARQAVVMAEEVMDEIPIMEELDEPLPAYVLARGAYDALKDESTRVSRAIPESLGLPFPQGAPQNRLGLAQWVVQPDHPLTSRVFVNRIWANFFGAGLVRTPENFGLTGEPPSHSELLDWLARHFVESGWNIKELCKAIVLSATYRQNSTTIQRSLAADPENLWLARGPSHRLSAEQIRDLALAASGLLNREMGGPPVSPYQPGGDLWRENNGMSPPYVQSVGTSLYRRSLYSVWKRTAPLPNMMAFDTNSREVCTVKRQRTNTPLQALVLLNDVQFVEAPRYLAEQLLKRRFEPEKRLWASINTKLPFVQQAWRREVVSQAFEAFTSRLPDAIELQALLDLWQSEAEYYREHVDEAQKLIAVGETKTSWFLNKVSASVRASTQVEHASLAATIQAILNLDATVWSR